jgi:excisionase family DNA binding protein
MLETLERPMADDAADGGPPADLLTTEQVARELGVSRPTVFRLIERGRLTPVPSNPVLMRPRRFLFRREDVDKVKRGEA